MWSANTNITIHAYNNGLQFKCGPVHFLTAWAPIIKKNNVWFQKIPIPTPWKVIGNSASEGVWTAKIYKGKYEFKQNWKFQEGETVQMKKPSKGGSMDIFWSHTNYGPWYIMYQNCFMYSSMEMHSGLFDKSQIALNSSDNLVQHSHEYTFDCTLWRGKNLQIASFSSFAKVLLMSFPMCLKYTKKVKQNNGQ